MCVYEWLSDKEHPGPVGWENARPSKKAAGDLRDPL